MLKLIILQIMPNLLQELQRLPQVHTVTHLRHEVLFSDEHEYLEFVHFFEVFFVAFGG